MRAPAVASVVVLLAFGCGGDDDEEPLPTGVALPGFSFTKSGVAEGQTIDSRYTCDGDDLSPALAWEGVPADAAELVLVVDDPDAPGGTFTHWLAYGLDPTATSLPEGVSQGDEVTGPPALRQGVNDFGAVGYGGPCPPGGETHRYVFALYALDEETGLEGGTTWDELLSAIEGHVLAEATLTAPYSRASR